MTPPEILSETGDVFADLVLSIVADHQTAKGSRCFDVLATHEGELVGLRIELPTAWRPQQMGDLACFSGIVTYRSSGELSDRFVSLLDRLYGVELGASRMVNAARFAAITLGDDPSAIDSSVIRIKLFFEHDEHARYAEIYTNIDLPRGVVQIPEKDPGYRRALIRALSEGDF